MSGPNVSSEPHAHMWRGIAHLDGCHWYSWTYACECGATRELWSERDLEANSYSAVWMVREGDEEPCDRCDALMAGAEPQHRDEIRAGVA